MTDQLDFESRLEQRLRARAAIASRPFDAVEIAHRAVLVGGRRRFGPTLRLAARPAMYRGMLLALLALALVAIALVAGSRLLQDSTPLPGRWTTTGPMQDLRDHERAPSAMLLDGRVLFVGGTQDSEIVSSELFDPRTNSFSRTAGLMSGPRHGLSATTLLDGRVLVAGGSLPIQVGGPPLATAELFDPATGTFSPTGPLVVGREHHKAVLLADGRVLVLGGGGAEGRDLASAEIYDPGTGSWTLAGTMPQPRFAGAATALGDGRVLVTGGMDADGKAVATTELFDPSSGQFAPASPMVTTRYGHTTVVLADGRVLLVGGSDGALALANAELYDPATGRFSSTGSLVTERVSPAAVRLTDGRVMVAGGALETGSPLSAELYDPALGTFVQAAFSSGMHIGQAHRLPDGRVLVTGGQPEVFDPTAVTLAPTATSGSDRAFTATGDPTEHRVGHTATRLPDGRVLLIGGRSPAALEPSRDRLASAEIYDPKSGSFAATGSMRLSPAPQGPDTALGHFALLLEDGRVLVLGDGHFTWQLQIFDPAAGLFSDVGSLAPESVTVGRPMAAVQIGGRIMVFGPPLDRSSSVDSDAQAYELDVLQPRATKIADLAGCHGVDDAVALADGRVVLRCAGSGEREVRLFDPGTGQSSTLDVPSGERRSMVLLADGRVLFTNGDETTSLTIYDPVMGRTAQTGTLPALNYPDQLGRAAGPSLSVLSDGRVLIIGGLDAALWDPATNIATTLPPPLAIREGSTATLLDGGRVLVVGGTHRPTDRGVPAPPGAELFDPSALP